MAATYRVVPVAGAVRCGVVVYKIGRGVLPPAQLEAAPPACHSLATQQLSYYTCVGLLARKPPDLGHSRSILAYM